MEQIPAKTLAHYELLLFDKAIPPKIGFYPSSRMVEK